MRINKYIATCGICSRRKAEKLILEGKVKINQRTAKLTDQVQDKDVVMVRNIAINPQKNVYLLLNKPLGYTCTVKKIKGEKNIIELVRLKEKVFPVGRLDKNSKGLVILTSDGDFAQKIIHPSYNHEKIYETVIDNDINNKQIKKLLEGVVIEVDDERYLARAKKIRKINSKKLEITLTEGKKRQIRKMLDGIGLKVVELKRTRLAGLTLSGLNEGKWRHLTSRELKRLGDF
jgi:pseudouridine synthase